MDKHVFYNMFIHVELTGATKSYIVEKNDKRL